MLGGESTDGSQWRRYPIDLNVATMLLHFHMRSASSNVYIIYITVMLGVCYAIPAHADSHGKPKRQSTIEHSVDSTALVRLVATTTNCSNP